MTTWTCKYECPELMKIVDLVSAQNPLQRKRIKAFMTRPDTEYLSFAEDLSGKLNHTLLRSDQQRVEAARSYNQMCMDMLREQIRFRKTGSYPRGNARDAKEQIYDQPEIMRSYIVGLLLSYLFWPNHYRIFRFFREHLKNLRVRNCLEVGAGHGLFTAEVMRHSPGLDITVVDISEASIGLAREMLATFQLDPAAVRFITGDFLAASLPDKGFDFIVMGEVLEHVNDAPAFLKRARQVIEPGGTAFLSTCTNCPATDHVYHFQAVCQIRDTIRDAGFTIIEDLPLPAEDVPEERWEEELVTVNYCAILTG